MYIPVEVALADVRELEADRLEAIARNCANNLPEAESHEFLGEARRQIALRGTYREFLDSIGLTASLLTSFSYQMLAEIYSVLQDVQEYGSIRVALGETTSGGPLGVRSFPAASTADQAGYIVLDEKKAITEEGWCSIPANITDQGAKLLDSAAEYHFSEEAFSENLKYLLQIVPL